MAGPVVLACYRPKEGGEAVLLEQIRRHVPTLRERGLATGRPVLLLRTADGAYLELFQWVDHEAASRAHADPEVSAIWNAMEEVADFVTPASVEGLGLPFPHLEPIDGVVT